MQTGDPTTLDGQDNVLDTNFGEATKRRSIWHGRYKGIIRNTFYGDKLIESWKGLGTIEINGDPQITESTSKNIV